MVDVAHLGDLEATGKKGLENTAGVIFGGHLFHLGHILESVALERALSAVCVVEEPELNIGVERLRVGLNRAVRGAGLSIRPYRKAAKISAIWMITHREEEEVCLLNPGPYFLRNKTCQLGIRGSQCREEHNRILLKSFETKHVTAPFHRMLTKYGG